MTERSFGELLRDLRCAAGLSQEALAERARLSTGAISTLERRTRLAPQHQTLSLLVEALGLGPDERARFEAAAATGRKRGVRNGPSTAPPSATPHNLPNVLTTFHGREAELRQLAALLRERRLVTLLGPGGVGKTRLALEVGRAQVVSGSFPDGVYFVDLAAVARPEFVTTAIARAIGLRERAEGSSIQAIVDGISARRFLVLLDNCEHLIDSCASVAETILRSCAGIRIVATTREALRIDGECVVRVAPLPYGEECGASPALALLLDRLQDADFVQFGTISDDDRELAATICRRLDGIPLALELAAGRARDRSLARLAAGLDERFALLNDGLRTATPRQHTLRGMIDWSYALLAADERELFARLGLFADAFEPEAAEAICGDAAHANVRIALGALIAKSLVSVVEDRAGRLRYRLLETIRAYALDRLRESADFDRIARRFATYYLATARVADSRYGRMPSDEFLANVEPDLANFRYALEWSLGAKNDEILGAELAAAMGFIYRQTSLFAEGVDWAERALASAVPISPRIAGRLHMALSIFSFSIGGMGRALAAAIAATAAYRRTNEPAALAWSRMQEAYCLYRFGRLDEARAVAEEAVAAGRIGGDPLRLAGALNAFASTLAPDRTTERLAALEESIRCSEAAGDRDAIVARAHLAGAYFEAGEYARAYERARDVLAIARKNRDRSTVASALANIAACALALDDIGAAENAAREALRSDGESGKSLNAMCALEHLASVAARRGRFVRAARLEGASNALYAEFGLERERGERSLYDRTISEIRDALGEDALGAHLAEGFALPFDLAVAEGLRDL